MLFTDSHGHAVGWWNHEQVRDLAGRIVLLLRDAPHLGVPSPAFRPPPTPPVIRPVPAMPPIAPKPYRRLEKAEWGNGMAFLNQLTINGAGFSVRPFLGRRVSGSHYEISK